MRTTYVLRDGELVEKHLAAPLHSGDQASYVISDTMDAIRSMADGKMYDSKSQYRRELRARGCYEVGNDRMERSTTPLSRSGADIRRAIAELSSR